MASTKKTTAKVDNKPNKDLEKIEVVEKDTRMEELQKELQTQKETNTAIMDTLGKLLEKINELESKQAIVEDSSSNSSKEEAPIVEVNAPIIEEAPVYTAPKKALRREYVTIIHLLENFPEISTHIELTGCTIDFHTLGEERSLTWSQFEELAGRYKNLFDLDIIALSEEDSDLVGRYNLKTIGNDVMNRFYLNNLPNMKAEELEDLYNKLSRTHKSFIIGYWQRKFLEGDNRFKDRRKVELLNSLSNEALNNLIIELNEAHKRN